MKCNQASIACAAVAVAAALRAPKVSAFQPLNPSRSSRRHGGVMPALPNRGAAVMRPTVFFSQVDPTSAVLTSDGGGASASGLPFLETALSRLANGSDIRGRFLDHTRQGPISQFIQQLQEAEQGIPPLTPFAAYCLGRAFASIIADESPDKSEVVVAIGRDPRPHGIFLADSFARGAESVDRVRVAYTGMASTPAMYDFCRSSLSDGAVMITASHLPSDRNGMKFFRPSGGFTKKDVKQMLALAKDEAKIWNDKGSMPPSSLDTDTVQCSENVDWMPSYQNKLKQALMDQLESNLPAGSKMPEMSDALKGVKIVLNAGNGSGAFFYRVLRELGADVSGSIGVEYDSTFPNGVPNPEYAPLMTATTKACEEHNADLGIMLDTDADRSGFIIPRVVNEDGTRSDYEPLNRNRLIALLGVLFGETSPGCTFVTCSTTSNGLADFLTETCGIKHVRYLKGYANVIGKGRELYEQGINAEVAIETSGHCAMRENDWLDDGTYSAVKILGLLSREKSKSSTASLLDLISDMQEMAEVREVRMSSVDGSLETMRSAFQTVEAAVEAMCEDDAMSGPTSSWILDRENLEGVRVSLGDSGAFFMLRKSLHDPVMSLQIEADSRESALDSVIEPLVQIFSSVLDTQMAMDISNLKNY